MKTLGSVVLVVIALAATRDPAALGAVGAALLMIVSGGFTRRTQF